MPDQLLNNPLQWAQSHEVLLGWLAAGSVFAFVATLVGVSWFLVHIPQDYFIADDDRREPSLIRDNPALRVLLRILRNLLGAILIIAGILMLVLPGQGVLTIVVGLMLMTFPGKDRFTRYVVSRPKLHSSINSIRQRASREPLILKRRDYSGRNHTPR